MQIFQGPDFKSYIIPVSSPNIIPSLKFMNKKNIDKIALTTVDTHTPSLAPYLQRYNTKSKNIYQNHYLAVDR